MDRKILKKKVVIGERYWFTTFGLEFEVEIVKPADAETKMCEVKWIKILNEEDATGDVVSLLPGLKEMITKGTITPMAVYNLRKL